MILVVILVAAWLVVLGPSVLRRRAEHSGGVNSITHFHRQLRVLEHSGGQPIVFPAYRLHSSEEESTPPKSRYPDVATVPVLTVVGADRLPRPALAFLGDDPVPSQPRGAGSFRPAADPADIRSDPISGYRPADPELRSLARRRRRDTLTVLVVMVVLTFLIGFIPGAGTAWLVTLVGAVVLSAYVAMLVHMRSMAEERERKLHYLRPSAPNYGQPATDYQPGYQDDENASFEDEAGLRDPAAYQASRFAHPARQAAAH
jgi:hypothetical protein